MVKWIFTWNKTILIENFGTDLKVIDNLKNDTGYDDDLKNSTAWIGFDIPYY